MAITPLPPAPLPTDTPTEFNEKAFDLVAALEDFVTEANAQASAVDADATSADADAATATTQAGIATTQAGIATTKAGEAADSASAALTSANNAAASYDAFDDRYLGAKGSDPSVDNDGNALLTGALYWNTSSNVMKAWTGSAWEVTYVPAGDFLTSSDIGVSVQAYDSDLTTWAGKTAPSGTVVGTTDTQTLSGKTITGTKETVYTITDGAGFEIDPANGGIQSVTLGASRTPAATNFTEGQSVTLLIGDGTDYTITWTTVNPTWVGGSAPTLATTGYTVLEFWKVGSTIYGAYVGTVA